MTEKQAQEIMEKTIINGTPHINTADYMEALGISIDVLGADYTREQLKNWILVSKYPFLLPTYWNPDTMQYEVDKDFDYTWTLLEDMPKGWKNAFGEMMCEEIKNELIKFNALDDYRIEQIKEKYGQLRWYDNGAPIGCNVNEIIDKYSTLSENICMFCGKPDVPMTGNSWVYPMCKECYCTPNDYYIDKMNSAAIKEFREEHEKNWEKCKSRYGCKMQESYTISRWSKDGGTEEITYDISETANKIRTKWRIEHGECE